MDKNSEIVAANINNKTITNDPITIREAINLDLSIQFLTRMHMEFMASCDLGIRWENLAKSRTLFIIDQDGRPQANKN